MSARDCSGGSGGGGSSSSSDGPRGLFHAARVTLPVIRRARGASEKYACVRHEHCASVILGDMGAALYELSPPLRRVPPADVRAQVVEVLRQVSQEAGPAGGGELRWRK
jgi:hypothetical protein